MAEGWFWGDTAPPATFAPVWLTATAGASNPNATSVSSGTAFTPPASTLLIVAAAWSLASTSGVGSTATGISDTIGGLTWTEITAGWHGQTFFGSTESLKTSVFWAVTGASPPSGAVTITSTLATTLHFEVVKVPGANTSSPVGTTGLNNILGSFGGAQTLTATTGLTPAAGSCMVAVLGELTNPSASTIQPTDGTGFTNLFWATGAGSTLAADLDASYKAAGTNSTTWSMAANSSQFWNYDGILVEVKAAAASGAFEGWG